MSKTKVLVSHKKRVDIPKGKLTWNLLKIWKKVEMALSSSGAEDE